MISPSPGVRTCLYKLWDPYFPHRSRPPPFLLYHYLLEIVFDYKHNGSAESRHDHIEATCSYPNE